MRNLFIIIAVFLLCTLSYELSCRVLAKSVYRPSAQHQWDGNLIAWENFLFSDDNHVSGSVLVGTSLSGRLGTDFLLNNNSSNLSFAGGSPVTVLKILSTMDTPPHNIVLEMNYIDKPVSISIIKRYSSPLTIFLKKNFLMWRVKYKPITVIKTLSNNFIKKMKVTERKYKAVKKNPGGNASNTQNVVDQEEKILTVNLEMQNQFYSKSLQLNQNIILESILRLKEKKSNIFLLNMPVHSSLYSTKRMDEVLEFQDLIMEKTGVKLIQIDNANNKYKTTDGLHLKPSSVKQVRAEMINYLLQFK